MGKAIEVGISPVDHERLEAVVAPRNSPQQHVWRARIVPLSTDGVGTMEIHAARLIPMDAPQQRIHTTVDAYVRFKNDLGLTDIGIGVTEFKCVGASPPHDHPHTYHRIGEQGFVHCLYCNTKYVYRPYLDGTETEPPGNVFEAQSASTPFNERNG